MLVFIAKTHKINNKQKINCLKTFVKTKIKKYYIRMIINELL